MLSRVGTSSKAFLEDRALLRLSLSTVVRSMRSETFCSAAHARCWYSRIMSCTQPNARARASSNIKVTTLGPQRPTRAAYSSVAFRFLGAHAPLSCCSGGSEAKAEVFCTAFSFRDADPPPLSCEPAGEQAAPAAGDSRRSDVDVDTEIEADSS